MRTESIVEWLERIVIGGVALTSEALADATDGQELTFTQWRAVLLLGFDDDGCRVGEVAATLHASLPTASRLLRRLERRGLVDLAPDEHDRRATRARLTPAGTDLRAAVLAHRRARLASIVEGAAPPPAADGAIRDLADQFDRHARPSGWEARG